MSTPELLTGLGAACAIFLCTTASGIASIPAGIFALHSSNSNFLKSFGPIVIAGVLAIYGTIISTILVYKLSNNDVVLTMKDGYKSLSAGLVVGLSCLASGYSMSRFIDQSMTMVPMSSLSSSAVVAPRTSIISPESESLLGTNATPRDALKIDFTIQYFFCLTFLEAIGLYGLIVALLLVK